MVSYLIHYVKVPTVTNFEKARPELKIMQQAYDLLFAKMIDT